MKKEHWIFVSIGSVVAALVIFSVCRDYYLKNEARKVHERAEKAAREADDALRQYRQTEYSGKRLQELEKIYKIRGFTASEKEEARKLIDYMQRRAGETGYAEGERFFAQLRKEWELE